MAIIGIKRRFPGLVRRVGARGIGTGISAIPTLPLGDASYTNASPRYIRYNGLFTGPFAGGTPATRIIDGNTYVLIEQSVEVVSKNSEAVNNHFDDLGAVTNPSNAVTDPLGGSTASSYLETVDNANHIFRKTANDVPTVNATHYALSLYFKPNPRYQVRVRRSNAGLPNTVCEIDATALSVSPVVGAEPDWYSLQALDDGYRYFTMGKTATANDFTGIYFYLTQEPGFTLSYVGDITKGAIAWGVNVIKASPTYPMSYVKTVATGATKAKDILYWANAALPAWMKGSNNEPFTFNFVPNYSSTKFAANGADRFLFSIDGTENVECYIAAADRKLYIDVDAGNVFTSASAFTWSERQKLKITVNPNNGANCNVITSGFTTGNADETGTAFSLQTDGDLYLGLRHTTDDLQVDGLISEIRQGVV